MKNIISLTIVFLCSIILIPPKISANSGICGGQPGYDYAQTKGVSQGWLVPYNGENQSFTGIPCKVSEPSDSEINSIVYGCCNGETSVECLKKEPLVSWVANAPKCEERKLVVRKNKAGKLEAFDDNQVNDQQVIQSASPTNKPEIDDQNSSNFQGNRGFLENIWAKFVLFLKNLFQR